MKKIFFILLSFTLLLGGGVFILSTTTTITYATNETHLFIITQDDTTDSVVNRLIKEGYIQNSWSLQLAYTLKREVLEFYPGGYTITESYTMFEL